MRYLRIAALSIALLFVFAQADAQQAPWTWTAITGNNGSVILPYANSPTFNGDAIQAGDWLGAFGSNNEFCVGAILWEVNDPPQLANGLTVWGDDDQTTAVDGLAGGEVIQYRLWRQETGEEHIAETVSYDATSSNATGAYVANGIWVISSMTFIDEEPGFTISGIISYANTANTPMTNTTVSLISGQLIIATTQTSPTGAYSFENVENGEYTIACSTEKTWGGLNNTDGILVKRHIVSYSGFQLGEFQQKAADVQNNNVVNNTDAILMQRKIVGGNTNAWNLPDWVFEKPEVVVNGEDVTGVNIKALCAGDVNGSYTPPL